MLNSIFFFTNPYRIQEGSVLSESKRETWRGCALRSCNCGNFYRKSLTVTFWMPCTKLALWTRVRWLYIEGCYAQYCSIVKQWKKSTQNYLVLQYVSTILYCTTYLTTCTWHSILFQENCLKNLPTALILTLLPNRKQLTIEKNIPGNVAASRLQGPWFSPELGFSFGKFTWGFLKPPKNMFTPNWFTGLLKAKAHRSCSDWSPSFCDETFLSWWEWPLH